MAPVSNIVPGPGGEPTPPINSTRKLPKRRMLGWDQPILQSVVQQLLVDYAMGGTWDMRRLLVVLPGGLAGRRLGELLAMEAKHQGKILYPPQVITLGQLPEHLYVAKFPFASDLVQHLSWLKALQTSPANELTQIIPLPPPKSASQQWLELAKIFTNLHRELASDGLNFRQVVKTLGHHPETPRWEALGKIQSRYLSTLDDLKLWDIQTARLCALQYHEANTDKQIIVIGCVDLNRTQRGFLEEVAENVQVWIAAPESASQNFDEFGGLITPAWQEYEVAIPDDDLLVGSSPQDQAELTCAVLAELNDRYHTREVTIGVPDAALITLLKHQLDQVGVKSRYGPGTPLTQSEPALLLSLLGEYVDTSSFAAFAALIRHPAITPMLSSLKVELPSDWLAQIDQYYQAALPKQVDSFINLDAQGAEVYRTVAGVINRWLVKLTSRSRPISNWVPPLLAVLTAGYEKQMVDLEDPVEGPLFGAAAQVCEAILSLRDIPPELEPSMKVSELIEWLLRSLAGQLVPEPAEIAAVEMLGWLELALDDAPALIVTGIHDGVVPESASADAFLPNSLRRQLGMMDNARKYARDVYALQVMLRSRERVRFVVGKTDANGDPLIPSRLLMACELSELPNRVLHLVKEEEVDVLPAVATRWNKSLRESKLTIPQPINPRIPRHMTVTAFRDYLVCPYRFYLRHVLKLRDEHDADAELDAPMFGNLLHDTLEHLGKGPIARSADAVEIRDFLITKLHEVALARFGPNPPSAVLIQIEQAEQRLAAFAPRQAERAAEGWEIRYTEQGVSFEDDVLLGHDAQLHLIGRIDRIDYHPASGRWAIWDYKTSDNAKNPVSVHWTKTDNWKDLQLPLYRPVAEKLGVGDNPSLGYIALPKQASDVGFHIADFSAWQLREADAVAHEIASKVLAGKFWPDELGVPKYDDFARICQTNVQHVSVDPPQRRLTRHRSLTRVASAIVKAAEQLLTTDVSTKTTFEPRLIRASAGTGKTFQLTNRLLQIILSGQEVDQILASTFTRKAAGEIMHRVLQRLAQACVEEKSTQELSQHLAGVEVTAASCLAALRRVTRSIHRLRIGTLDSFFAQVARTFSLEMGLPPGWSAMDPIQEPQFQFQAIGQMLDNHDRKTLVDLVRMLAKGDSGRQISEQILQTVSRGYSAYRVTDEAAWDQLPLPSAPSEAAVESALLTLKNTEVKNKSGTSNKKANEQLQKLHQCASIGDWEAVVAHGIYANIDEDPPSYYRSELDSGLVVALQLLLERAAAELLPIRRNQTLASYKVLDAFNDEYTALVRRRRGLAFSDISYYLSQWMEPITNPHAKRETGVNLASRGAAQLAFRLDCGVQHLLLDEFQDTAPEQWQILRPLAIPLGGQPTTDHSFFCVGDTKQAIYGWRGGVAEIFDSVDKSVDELKQSQMSDSYRSSPEVMRAVNTVFQNLPNHSNFANCNPVAEQWSHAFPEHRTSRSNLPGYVRLQNGPKINNGVMVNERKQIFLQYTAKQIAELTSRCDVSVGVLFRTNADVGRMISLLRDLGVSASQDGGNPLTDSVAVELLLSLLHLADHPGDGLCAFHLATSPLAKLAPLSTFESPHELAHWFRQTVVRRGLGAAIELVANMLADQLSWWDQHRLEQLIRMSYDYQPRFTGRLRDFEDAVLRSRVALPTEAQVKVMTIHKSKGLEFDAVFLPELDVELSSSNSLFVLRGSDPIEPPDGVLRYMNANLQAMLPESWQNAFEQHKQRGVTESLCMLYVAMTRARQALIMTARPTSHKALQEFGSLLQSTLGGGNSREEAEALLYEDGNPHWYRSSTESPQQTALTVEPLTVTLRQDADSAPSRGLRISAPSSVAAAQEPVSLASAFSYSYSVGVTHGKLMHTFFEQVAWLEDYRFDPAQLRRVALATIDAEPLRHLSLERTIQEFEEQLRSASVRAALSKSRYKQRWFGEIPDTVEIDNERSVSLVVENKLVAGTIDRLAVLMKNGRPYAAEIFDFKSDTFDQRMSLLWLEDRVAHHRPQLDLYAQVVSRMFELPRERVASYLVMLSSDNLVRCESFTSRPHQLAVTNSYTAVATGKGPN